MGYLSSIAGIVVINLVLSGDNAVVIGMAAHRLEPRQRAMAIWIGGAAAIVLRVVLTVGAALLLRIPAFDFIGGLLLVYIGFSLLKEEEASHEARKSATTMKEAMLMILIADLVMSVDNVIGVAAASNGNLPLLIFGLTLSMAIVLCLGGAIAVLIHRFWWLAYAGAAAILWTAMSMILQDPYASVVTSKIDVRTKMWVSGIVTAGMLAFAHWRRRVRKTD